LSLLRQQVIARASEYDAKRTRMDSPISVAVWTPFNQLPKIQS